MLELDLIIGELKMKDENFDKKFNEIRKLLRSEEGSTQYSQPYIQRLLHEDNNLRKVFLAIIKDSPALIHEVAKSTLLTKPTCYSRLHKLLDLKLIERIYYSDIVNKKRSNDKEVVIKFKEFTSKMPDQVRRYFEAKTSFWKINDYGKKLAEWAYRFKQEFEEKKQ